MVILTQHQDNLRSGNNPNEKTLTTHNVTAAMFGKLREFAVDGSVYAQPLVACNVTLPGQTQPTNVLYVATMHNSVYGFDVTSLTGGKQLWHRKLGDPIQLPNPQVGPYNGSTAPPAYKDIAWEVGIVSTPVIDTAAGVIFVVSTNQDQNNNITHTLWKLGLDGSILAATTPLSATYGTKTFVSNLQLQRAGLALANGLVYLAFAAYGDRAPWQGWVLGYDASTLVQKAVFCTQPNQEYDAAGIWQAGQAPAVDEQGNLYFMTGNAEGKNDANGTNPTKNEFGCSVLKLSPTLQVVDYFCPFDANDMSRVDDDLGSGGILLIPGTNLVTGGGKRSALYLMDRSNLGKYSTSTDNVLQKFYVYEPNIDPQGTGTHHIHGSPVYYQGPNGVTLFCWPENMEMKQMSLTLPGGSTSLAITARSNVMDPDTFPGGTAGMPGGFMTVACNGNPAKAGTGVLWVNHPYQGDANQSVRPGVLRAFDPENVATELWSSRNNYARDDSGNFAKFCAPTVSNGFVFQPSMGGLQQRLAVGQATNYSPALASQADKLLMLAFTGPNGSINTMLSPDGLTWDPNSLGIIPNQASQFQPGLAFDSTTGTTYIAYTGTDTANDGSVNIAKSTDPGLKTWSDPVVTPGRSFTGPALAFGDGLLFVAWTGTDANKSINIASTNNGGQTWLQHQVLGETSGARPDLVFNSGRKTLTLSWSGQGNNFLNFIEYSDYANFAGAVKTILSTKTTAYGLSADVDPSTGSPVVAWVGPDAGANNINTVTSETQDYTSLTSPSTRFRLLYDNFQSSTDGPSICSFQGKVCIAWTYGGQKNNAGQVTGGAVNTGVLSRGSVCVYGLLGTNQGTTAHQCHHVAEPGQQKVLDGGSY
ncbi:hypothetical protein QBC46DRAFT_317427 [Diplogelasinospora grovesii]|uniref:Pyrrolo-quinoline quinone n=1 Tax=Diplogelasinospora grovesii TaxID=303347 RepID=A0AAN6N3M8_9PEZI|nr:hypothetical protein QBC46DRAFT_317427 [Diplogelasinospora grovesii]